MNVNFIGIKFSLVPLSFLSMITVNEVLYIWCLRYNICSAWFLDIRISTCYSGFDGAGKVISVHEQVLSSSYLI